MLAVVLDTLWMLLAVLSVILLVFDSRDEVADRETHITSVVCAGLFFVLTDTFGQNRILAHAVSALALSAALKQARGDKPPFSAEK